MSEIESADEFVERLNMMLVNDPHEVAELSRDAASVIRDRDAAVRRKTLDDVTIWVDRLTDNRHVVSEYYNGWNHAVEKIVVEVQDMINAAEGDE